MNQTHVEAPDEHMEDNSNLIETNAEQRQEYNGQYKHAGIASWVVSGALHATALLLAGTIYFLSAEPEQEIPISMDVPVITMRSGQCKTLEALSGSAVSVVMAACYSPCQPLYLVAAKPR